MRDRFIALKTIISGAKKYKSLKINMGRWGLEIDNPFQAQWYTHQVTMRNRTKDIIFAKTRLGPVWIIWDIGKASMFMVRDVLDCYFRVLFLSLGLTIYSYNAQYNLTCYLRAHLSLFGYGMGFNFGREIQRGYHFELGIYLRNKKHQWIGYTKAEENESFHYTMEQGAFF